MRGDRGEQLVHGRDADLGPFAVPFGSRRGRRRNVARRGIDLRNDVARRHVGRGADVFALKGLVLHAREVRKARKRLPASRHGEAVFIRIAFAEFVVRQRAAADRNAPVVDPEQRVGKQVSRRLAAEQTHGGGVHLVEQAAVGAVADRAVDQREAVAARRAYSGDAVGPSAAAEDLAVPGLYVGAQREVERGGRAVAQRAALKEQPRAFPGVHGRYAAAEKIAAADEDVFAAVTVQYVAAAAARLAAVAERQSLERQIAAVAQGEHARVRRPGRQARPALASAADRQTFEIAYRQLILTVADARPGVSAGGVGKTVVRRAVEREIIGVDLDHRVRRERVQQPGDVRHDDGLLLGRGRRRGIGRALRRAAGGQQRRREQQRRKYLCFFHFLHPFHPFIRVSLPLLSAKSSRASSEGARFKNSSFFVYRRGEVWYDTYPVKTNGRREREPCLKSSKS